MHWQIIFAILIAETCIVTHGYRVKRQNGEGTDNVCPTPQIPGGFATLSNDPPGPGDFATITCNSGLELLGSNVWTCSEKENRWLGYAFCLGAETDAPPTGTTQFLTAVGGTASLMAQAGVNAANTMAQCVAVCRDQFPNSGKNDSDEGKPPVTRSVSDTNDTAESSTTVATSSGTSSVSDDSPDDQTNTTDPSTSPGDTDQTPSSGDETNTTDTTPPPDDQPDSVSNATGVPEGTATIVSLINMQSSSTPGVTGSVSPTGSTIIGPTMTTTLSTGLEVNDTVTSSGSSTLSTAPDDGGFSTSTQGDTDDTNTTATASSPQDGGTTFNVSDDSGDLIENSTSATVQGGDSDSTDEGSTASVQTTPSVSTSTSSGPASSQTGATTTTRAADTTTTSDSATTSTSEGTISTSGDDTTTTTVTGTTSSGATSAPEGATSTGAGATSSNAGVTSTSTGAATTSTSSSTGTTGEVSEQNTETSTTSTGATVAVTDAASAETATTTTTGTETTTTGPTTTSSGGEVTDSGTSTTSQPDTDTGTTTTTTDGGQTTSTSGSEGVRNASVVDQSGGTGSFCVLPALTDVIALPYVKDRYMVELWNVEEPQRSFSQGDQVQLSCKSENQMMPATKGSSCVRTRCQESGTWSLTDLNNPNYELYFGCYDYCAISFTTKGFGPNKSFYFTFNDSTFEVLNGAVSYGDGNYHMLSQLPEENLSRVYFFPGGRFSSRCQKGKLHFDEDPFTDDKLIPVDKGMDIMDVSCSREGQWTIQHYGSSIVSSAGSAWCL